jgi:hypothetical protein
MAGAALTLQPLPVHVWRQPWLLPCMLRRPAAAGAGKQCACGTRQLLGVAKVTRARLRVLVLPRAWCASRRSVRSPGLLLLVWWHSPLNGAGASGVQRAAAVRQRLRQHLHAPELRRSQQQQPGCRPTARAAADAIARQQTKQHTVAVTCVDVLRAWLGIFAVHFCLFVVKVSLFT